MTNTTNSHSLIIAEDISHILSSPIINWAAFSRGRFLITGITGLIGSYLFETLATLALQNPDSKIHVFGLARNESRARLRFSHLLGQNSVHLIVHDITDPSIQFPEFDYIIHAASEASPKHYLKDRLATIRANIFGSHKLLELSRRNGSRFLFLSSGTVYGKNTRTTQPTNETDFGPYDPLDSRACYAESKRMAETMCSSYHQQYGVEAIIARISHTYGPGVELDDGRVFGDFIADAVAGRNIRVLGHGHDSRPFLYITDAVRGLLLLLQKGVGGNAYNLGAETEITIRDLAKVIANLCGQSPTFSLAADSDHAPSSAARSQGHFALDKIKALGWQPEIDIKKGFSRTLSHFGVHARPETT